MEPTTNNFFGFLKGLSHTAGLTIVAVAASVILSIACITWLNRDNHAILESNRKIDLTPTLIQSIKDIGEWEFLSVNDEELADTTRQGFFGDSRLSRIYYGTLRIGINLHDARPGWLQMDHDTVAVLLPDVRLLDNDFIDEAKTRSFYEEGTWSNADREALYHRAYTLMRRRCLTAANLESARQNAGRQFTGLLRSMGFDYTRIRFQQPQRTNRFEEPTHTAPIAEK